MYTSNGVEEKKLNWAADEAAGIARSKRQGSDNLRARAVCPILKIIRASPVRL